MPGYIKKVLQNQKHTKFRKPEHAPYLIPQKQIGKAAHEPDPVDESP